MQIDKFNRRQKSPYFNFLFADEQLQEDFTDVVTDLLPELFVNTGGVISQGNWDVAYTTAKSIAYTTGYYDVIQEFRDFLDDYYRQTELTSQSLLLELTIKQTSGKEFVSVISKLRYYNDRLRKSEDKYNTNKWNIVWYAELQRWGIL